MLAQDYNSLTQDNILDSVVISRCNRIDYPFSKLAPEWENQPTSPAVPSISKCKNLFETKNPNNYVPTLNQPDPCSTRKFFNLLI